ncbi:MAG: chromate resistance protein ChrB [Actinomycetota bacterium]|nr:chromate resistance protein ChrB [Actinomycetota bacterium]
MRWTILAVRIKAEPSRHRVAVWRELRRAGAVPLGPGTWAIPDTPAFADLTARVTDLTNRGEGELIVLRGEPATATSAASLEALYTEAREAEWAEFVSECHKYRAELNHEIKIAKLTLAELDEEEQSFERLRRWHRELTIRDVFTAPSSSAGRVQLDACNIELDHYTDLVYRALDPQAP